MEIRTLEQERILHLKALINRAAHMLNHERTVKALPTTPSQRRILALLGVYGILTQQRLLDEVEIAPASLSEIIGKLESKGLVTRERLEQDKRITLVGLTEEGRICADEIIAEEEDTAHEVFAQLDDQEKEQLEALLERIVEPRFLH